MAFKRSEVVKLLTDVHRRCCICHRFCGVKIEIDHISPRAENGSDDIQNAIPVCFECHAEIHSYNDKHPRGRKYQPNELQVHKEQWLKICDQHPELFVAAARPADVGPLQALIDELEFNLVVSRYTDGQARGALFADEQLRRAIAQGAIATIEPSMKQNIMEAYRAMSRANQRILAEMNQDSQSKLNSAVGDAARTAIVSATPMTQKALDCLMSFLGSERDEPTEDDA